MATLGDLLAAARRDSTTFLSWLGEIDAALTAAIAQAAREVDLDPAGFVRLALSDFSRLASEEDWATLMSGMRGSADPGKTCLTGMVRWRLNRAPFTTAETGALQGQPQ